MKQYLLLNYIHRIYKKLKKTNVSFVYENNVNYFDQKANDYILTRLEECNEGLMISKFGTIELRAVVAYVLRGRGRLNFKEKLDYIQGKVSYYSSETIEPLCNNAGFFPKSEKLQDEFAQRVLNDIKYIDILASYIDSEKYLKDKFDNVIRVNLNGFYAPFMWNEPWTQFLKGKKVLIVHPFVDSIKKQYNKREYLFNNPKVLPEFKSICFVKAIQSIGCNSEANDFKTWFDALEYMENEIDKREYDVALIGCGAYGMNLAAHVKRQGKIAIHLAGWTQMLFGIYGNRWVEDQPEFKKYINEYWVRPSEEETPKVAESVEKGCYW